MTFKKKPKKANALTRTDLKVFEVFRTQHTRAWKQGREHLIDHSLSSLFAAATMGLVLSLPRLLFCFLEKSETFNDKVGPSYTITAFTNPELSLEEARQFQKAYRLRIQPILQKLLLNLTRTRAPCI